MTASETGEAEASASETGAAEASVTEASATEASATEASATGETDGEPAECEGADPAVKIEFGFAFAAWTEQEIENYDIDTTCVVGDIRQEAVVGASMGNCCHFDPWRHLLMRRVQQ